MRVLSLPRSLKTGREKHSGFLLPTGYCLGRTEREVQNRKVETSVVANGYLTRMVVLRFFSIEIKL